MVRRRKQSPIVSLAAWVTTFTPGDWTGVDIFRQWRLWQAAVRDYCDLHDIARLDVTTWMGITRHTYDVGRDLREQFPSDGTPSELPAAPMLTARLPRPRLDT